MGIRRMIPWAACQRCTVYLERTLSQGALPSGSRWPSLWGNPGPARCPASTFPSSSIGGSVSTTAGACELRARVIFPRCSFSSRKSLMRTMGTVLSEMDEKRAARKWLLRPG